jgi:hypothetical protein
MRLAHRAEPIDYLTDQGIHGNPSFGTEFAERYVENPLVRPEGAHTVKRQIHTFTDARSGMA